MNWQIQRRRMAPWCVSMVLIMLAACGGGGGGNSSCSVSGGTDVYSRFDRAFNSPIGNWLAH